MRSPLVLVNLSGNKKAGLRRLLKIRTELCSKCTLTKFNMLRALKQGRGLTLGLFYYYRLASPLKY